MRHRLVALIAGAMLIFAFAGSAFATGPGCSDFGAGTAGYAQAGGFGKLVSFVAHGGLPGYAGVSQLVQDEHMGEIFTWPCAKYR